MAKTKELLPVSIRGDKNIEALCEAIDKVFSLEEELDKLFIYIIDKVPSSALEMLGWQFHIEGWELAQTDEEKRTLIKKAIELHRYKGTPWAVKESIKATGYKNIEIEERLPEVKYNGQYYYAGTEDYMGGVRWALFKVLIDLGEQKSLTIEDINKIQAVINEYKNVRSHLKEISFQMSVVDEFNDFIDAIMTIITASYDDILPWGLRYDGSISHNQAIQRIYSGVIKYNGQTKYDEWLITGKKYDTEWDILDTIFSNYIAEDTVQIDPRYDGKLIYTGFRYGSDTPHVIDGALTLTITKHIRHDGKYNYGGIYYNNTFNYNASKNYFGGIFYRGNIISQEALQ